MKILAFDIGGTEIKYALCDESFALTDKNSTPTRPEEGGIKMIGRVVEIIKSFPGVDRVGVATAGQVDPKKGEIIFASRAFPDYTGVNVKKVVESATGIPAAVENDVNAAAIGEHIFGAAKGRSDFICLTYGTGVGGAAFVNGELLVGRSSSAGEFGHIVTHANGRSCPCGGRGCYERYASASALVREVSAYLDEPVDGKRIFSSLDDPEIKKLVNLWIDEIVVGLKSLIYVFNPPLVILGGGIMNEDYIIERIKTRLFSKLMGSFKNVEIVRAENGNDAGKLGAAYLASRL